MNIGKTAAIVLAAGQGKRMQAGQPKQFMLLGGRPVLYYALAAFEKSEVDEIILVTGADEIDYCRAEIVEHYGFRKVTQIIPGGKERYHSVHAGLQAARGCDLVLIHDGARPFVDGMMLQRVMDCLATHPACVVGMPVQDTIKMSTEDGCVAQTLPREKLWTIQTPQAFSYPLIKDAYDKMIRMEEDGCLDVKITDDAMVAEYISKTPVRLIEGSYNNIKITTPEDLVFASAVVHKMMSGSNDIF